MLKLSIVCVCVCVVRATWKEKGKNNCVTVDRLLHRKKFKDEGRGKGHDSDSNTVKMLVGLGRVEGLDRVGSQDVHLMGTRRNETRDVYCSKEQQHEYTQERGNRDRGNREGVARSRE